jgi:cob(I)alamin adenosyltransferase
MGKRLSKVYTRTGDDGSTGLGDGTRVAKDDPRVEVYGTVDELNSQLGVVLAGLADPGSPAAVRAVLTRVQHELFDLGSELCMPGYRAIDEAMVSALERDLDAFNAELPALEEFILPGGGAPAAHCHVARTVCRRAERRLQTLLRAQPHAVAPPVGHYLNRLSDLLFVIARVLARASGSGEEMWRSPRLER